MEIIKMVEGVEVEEIRILSRILTSGIVVIGTGVVFPVIYHQNAFFLILYGQLRSTL